MGLQRETTGRGERRMARVQSDTQKVRQQVWEDKKCKGRGLQGAGSRPEMQQRGGGGPQSRVHGGQRKNQKIKGKQRQNTYQVTRHVLQKKGQMVSKLCRHINDTRIEAGWDPPHPPICCLVAPPASRARPRRSAAQGSIRFFPPVASCGQPTRSNETGKKLDEARPGRRVVTSPGTIVHFWAIDLRLQQLNIAIG